MQDFPAIPIFISVIEEGSFSKAAERLGITKSAVSKRISNLEMNLGVKLMHRTTRKLSLTEAGARYFEHASHALAAAQDAEFAAAELQEEPKGTIRISTPMSFGRLHVAPIIPRFLVKYPQIIIDMDMSDLYRDVVAEGFDVALSARLPESNLVARKLAPLHSVLCASPKYLERHGAPNHPQELVGHNCILYSYHTVVHEWVFKQSQEEIRMQVKGNFKVNNSEALREALEQGLGIGRLPTFVAGQDIQDGKLVPVLNEYRMPNKLLYAVFPERRYMPLKVRVFLDFMIEQLGGDTPYWDCWD